MKKIVALILAAMMTLSMTAAFAEGGKLAEIQAAGKIVVCTDPAWAPFEYIGADGAAVGADMDLAAYIAEALGVQLEILNVAFDAFPNYLVSGEADMSLSAITITEERKETLDFSIPYTTAQQYIIVKEDNETVKVLDDLAGQAIGVHLGTTGDFLVSDECMMGVLAGTGAEARQYKFLTDAALALQNGELGAIVCDTMLAENLAAVNEGLKCFPLAFKAGEAEIEQLAIAMKKGDAEFVAAINEIIAPIIEDGTFDQWLIKHSELASALN